MKAKQAKDFTPEEAKRTLEEAETEMRRIMGDPDASDAEKQYAAKVCEALGLDAVDSAKEARAISRAFGADHRGPARAIHSGTSMTLPLMTREQAAARAKDLEAVAKSDRR